MSEEWVTIKTFQILPLAEIARFRLDEAGIVCRLDNVEVVSTNGMLSTAVGNIRLDVPQNLVGQACEILNTAQAEAFKDVDFDDDVNIDNEHDDFDKHESAEPESEFTGDQNPYREPTTTGSASPLTTGPSLSFDKIYSWRKPVILLFLSGPIFGIVIVFYFCLEALGRALFGRF